MWVVENNIALNGRVGELFKSKSFNHMGLLRPQGEAIECRIGTAIIAPPVVNGPVGHGIDFMGEAVLVIKDEGFDCGVLVVPRGVVVDQRGDCGRGDIG